MITIGIDPGQTGALARLLPGVAPEVADLPTEAGRIDVSALSDILRKWIPAADVGRVAMEKLHARPGFDVTTQGDLMRMVGTIEGVVRMLRFDLIEIDPKTWKRFYGLKSDKRSSVECAARIFPDAGVTMVKHHNRAEALLIAHYAARKAQ